MADNTYEIPYSDTRIQEKISVEENTTDADTTPLEFIGHGEAEYGLAQNTNFLHLLENFACPPSDDPEDESYILKNPVKGQLWYKKIGDTADSTDFELCVYDGSKWVSLSKIITRESLDVNDPVADVGQTAYNTSTGKLYVFNGEEWISVGPVDTTHTETDTWAGCAKPGNTRATYQIPDPDHIRDITLADDIVNDVNYGSDDVNEVGSMHLIKLNILAKEFINGSDSEAVNACAWIYNILIRSINRGSLGYKHEVVGEPSYELIGKSSNTLPWKIGRITYDAEGLKVPFDAVSLASNHYVVIKFNSEIIKV